VRKCSFFKIKYNENENVGTMVIKKIFKNFLDQHMYKVATMCIMLHPNVLSNISDEFKNNKEIVMLAVTQTSLVLH
tara:strand:+ start:332 stop:559 length:228 start_codon:yes stop_codon:yes gene_type:complete